MSKTKIFISAYACEPNMGTEIGVGWHWVLEMSRYYELWVLTRESNRKHIEDWMAQSKETYDIYFVYFDLPRTLRFWKKGLRGVRIYYTIWMTLTEPIVKKTMQENNIHIYHLLTYGNSLWKASRYGIKQVFIWGPTGGVDSIPAEYSRHYASRARLIELVRRTVVKTLPLNPGFQRRCRNADLIFCKSRYMYEAIPETYRTKAEIFTDVAAEMSLEPCPCEKDRGGVTRYIAVGRLDAWRGFDLLIEASGRAAALGLCFHLDILGEGKDRKRLEKLIEKLNLSSTVTLHGQVPIERYYQAMREADVVVNPCLKEGAVTAAFDALALAKPFIGIDTGGYTRYFAPEYSIIIPRKSREKTIFLLEQALLSAAEPSVRSSMQAAAVKVREQFSWKKKGEQIHLEIERMLSGKEQGRL